MGVAMPKGHVSVLSMATGAHCISGVVGLDECHSLEGGDVGVIRMVPEPASSSDGGGLGNEDEAIVVSVLWLTKNASLASMLTLLPRTFLTLCAAHVEASRNFTSTLLYSHALPLRVHRVQEGLTSSHWNSQHEENDRERITNLTPPLSAFRTAASAADKVSLLGSSWCRVVHGSCSCQGVKREGQQSRKTILLRTTQPQ